MRALGEAKLALEQFKAPRTLSEEEIARITAAVSSFAGQEYSGGVVVSVPDGQQLWNTLDWILQKAKWSRAAKTYNGDRSANPPYDLLINAREGVAVLFPANAPNASRAGKAFVDALSGAGISAHVSENNGPRLRDNIIEIEIGAKPK
ncbi:MAG: hypothetical protein WDM89_12380 [Rhizomicrobium sp.]